MLRGLGLGDPAGKGFVISEAAGNLGLSSESAQGQHTSLQTHNRCCAEGYTFAVGHQLSKAGRRHHFPPTCTGALSKTPAEASWFLLAESSNAELRLLECWLCHVPVMLGTPHCSPVQVIPSATWERAEDFRRLLGGFPQGRAHESRAQGLGLELSAARITIITFIGHEVLLSF